MDSGNLATELLSTLKGSIKRLYIAILILIILLFASNVAWLYAWNLPKEESTSESYDIQAEDDGNAVYNENGGVNIGTSESDEN